VKPASLSRPGLSRRRALATLAASLVAGPGRAQAAWPTRPVRLIVPLAPGGTADGTARLLGDKLATLWGQPVIVDNRAGAAGIIGMEAIARAEPDGYTLGMGNINTIATNHLLRPKLSYDPLKDFTDIAWLTTSPLFLIVYPGVPAASLNEFIAYARANPNKLSYASIGSGSSMHLAMEMLQQRTGIQLMHVPYKGMGAAVQDLIAGNVSSTIDITTMAMVHAGKLRALAVASDQRYPREPDVPSFGEAGLKGLELMTWLSLHGPARLPPELAMRINADVNRVLAMPEVKSGIEAMNLDPVGGSPDALRAMLDRERSRYAELIRQANITVD
jgi:tripartite-type tricarboxylate transporter receptor subunit TctC